MGCGPTVCKSCEDGLFKNCHFNTKAKCMQPCSADVTRNELIETWEWGHGNKREENSLNDEWKVNNFTFTLHGKKMHPHPLFVLISPGFLKSWWHYGPKMWPLSNYFHLRNSLYQLDIQQVQLNYYPALLFIALCCYLIYLNWAFSIVGQWSRLFVTFVLNLMDPNDKGVSVVRMWMRKMFICKGCFNQIQKFWFYIYLRAKKQISKMPKSIKKTKQNSYLE